MRVSNIHAIYAMSNSLINVTSKSIKPMYMKVELLLPVIMSNVRFSADEKGHWTELDRIANMDQIPNTELFGF